MSSSRQLAAIMFTDIVGYTTLMEQDEQKAMGVLDKNRKIQGPLIERHNGKWLKEMGDGILASFSTVSDAVYCAGAIQKACESEPMLVVRIGIHEGEVVFKDDDVFGSGVNIASRLESIAQAGGILVSESVYRNIKNKEGLKAEFLREETLKNVDEPIKVYQVKVERDEFPEKVATRPLEHPPKVTRWKGMKIGAAIIILFLLGYAGYQYWSIESPSPAPSETAVAIDKSIAVLPFANMSNDLNQQYFSDGVMEAILNNLTKIKEFKVISRTSVMQYRNTLKTSPQIAKELGVAFLLEGGVQTFEGHVRINAQLIDAVQDKHVWSENYDRQLTDIFAIQSEIAKKIASALSTVLSPRELAEIEFKGTANLEAYNLYLTGRYFWNKRTEAGLKRSIEYFEQSLAADPEYALAYSGLADAYYILVFWGGLPASEGFPKAKENAMKALKIDPNLAEAHATLGSVAQSNWKWEEAATELLTAIELNPNYATGRQYYAEYLDAIGQTEDARKQINRALELDPLSLMIHLVSSGIYFNAGELEKALSENQKVLDLDMNRTGPHWRMFIIYREQGRDEEAFKQLKKSWSVDSSSVKYMDGADNIYTTTGIDGVIRWWMDLETNKTSNDPAFIASHYAILGEKELALYWLERAMVLSPRTLTFLRGSRMFESLRSEPRFEALLQKIYLEADY